MSGSIAPTNSGADNSNSGIVSVVEIISWALADLDDLLIRLRGTRNRQILLISRKLGQG